MGALTVARDRLGVKSIFDEAAEMASPEDRAAYLERACGGDADVRRQVDALLRALDQAGSFLVASPALAAPGDTEASALRPGPGVPPARTSSGADPSRAAGSPIPVPPLAEGPGTMIGPYKLLQKIGEGGMGAVFMAEQERPVRRKVALKVIKPGMDTAQVIARFEAERQALAMMDHPHIARVLDAGATETGRPFFVMELVRGVPITEYCDRHGLTPTERLELFIPVCQAIQHAHQKGIIHRDIKPSNVLVALHDGEPVPKVIDFGVAKAIEQRLTERTLFTEFGAVIGTLEYMSPEQAEIGVLDVDTRSDIYSLGVVLYELLTGSTPLEQAKVRQAAYAEVLRRIREEEPTRPSTRLSESKDTLPSISAQRKMDPARLTKFLRGDLDWIVMKALEKDRTRRYETANGLARDIRRYLDGDPVEACPPSPSYRLGKFARKHRLALTTAGTFAVLLIAATAVSVGLALWADRERVRAVKAEGEAKEQKGQAEEQKARAEEREQLAIDAVKRFGDAIRESPELKNEPALAPLRARLLKKPQGFFKRLRDRLEINKGTSFDSLQRLASASFELAELTSEIGDGQDALRSYLESLAIREQLASDYPSVTQIQSDLARTYHNTGYQQRMQGRPAEALTSFEKALAIRERLVGENPRSSRYQADRGWTQQHLAADLYQMGRLADALTAHERARALFEKLALERPTDNQIQLNLAACYTLMGRIQFQSHRLDEAMAWHERARALRERLASEHPGSADFARGLATKLIDMASIDLNESRFDKVRAQISRGMELLRKVLAADPADARARQLLDDDLTLLVRAARGLYRTDEATEAARERAALRDSDPRDAALDVRLAAVLGGKQSPADEPERTRLAFRAYRKSLHASSARLCAEAVANDPRLAPIAGPSTSTTRPAPPHRPAWGSVPTIPGRTKPRRRSCGRRRWVGSGRSCRRGGSSPRPAARGTSISSPGRSTTGSKTPIWRGSAMPPGSPGSSMPNVRSGRTSGPEWTPCARASRRGERPLRRAPEGEPDAG